MMDTQEYHILVNNLLAATERASDRTNDRSQYLYHKKQRDERIAEIEAIFAQQQARIAELEARPAPPVHVDAAPPNPKLAIGDMVWFDKTIRHVVSRDWVQSDAGNYWDYGLSLDTNGCPCIMVNEAKLLPDWKAAYG